MESYRNILLATDFSEYSERAARRAANVARCLGAQLTVLHIIDYCPENIPLDIISPEDLNPGEILVHRAYSSLASLADRCGLNDAARKVILSQRASHSARKEIIQYAEKHGMDLIVIATHGHHGLTPLLGSTADRVVRGAPCDVLAVRARESVEGLIDYSRILGATDFLDPSYSAARRVTSLVKSYNAVLMLLHVVEDPPELLHSGWIEPEGVDYANDLRMRTAQDSLQKLAEAIEYPEAEQHAITSTETAAQVIIDFAEAQAVDLIAVGAYGHYGIDFFLGSTAERVLHGAACDVLVARLPMAVKSG